MSHANDIPIWLAILVGVFLVAGAMLTLIGSVGLIRLRNFYERAHAPTLGSTLGTGFILIASTIYFSTVGLRPVIHEILIGAFVTATTPVTLMLLSRAALYRDRAETFGKAESRKNVERSVT